MAALDRVPGIPRFCILLLAGIVCAELSGQETAPGKLENLSEAEIVAGVDQLLHGLRSDDRGPGRDAGLRRDSGWLSLVGLDWLESGANRVGSAFGNDIVVPGGAARWGTVYLEGDGLRFERTPGTDVTIGGQQPDAAPLTADNAGDPTVVASGSVSFAVIFRGSYALRVKDSQAPALLNFKGIESYEIQPGWRIRGRYQAAGADERVEISNVLGQVESTAVHGRLEFDRDGKTHRLIGVASEAGDSVWFIFADRTNGRETYGAGRFVYSEGLPANGEITVDFNKAYNPPCAFTEFSTCPLPPPENRLDLAVTAGEKSFHTAPGG